MHEIVLQFHADIPGAPDDGSQVAHLVSIADDVDMLILGGQGSALVAGGEDHGVGGDLKLQAVLVYYGHAVIVDLGQLGFQMDGNLVGFEEVTQEAGVGQADTGGDPSS